MLPVGLGRRAFVSVSMARLAASPRSDPTPPGTWSSKYSALTEHDREQKALEQYKRLMERLKRG